MDIHELKTIYEDLLHPVFGEQFRIDDSDEDKDWVVILLDGEQEDFYFSLYGIDSSDTYGEVVFESDFDIEYLPHLIVDLIMQLKDCTYITKREIVKGKIPSGYDDIKEYVITAKTENLNRQKYQLANITIEYVV